MAGPASLFYYSHKDEDLRDQLEGRLAPLKLEGVISDWHERRIAPEQEADAEIEPHLNEAKIILLLVTPDFMASSYLVDRELRQAMSRHMAGKAKVIPILGRQTEWKHAPFHDLAPLPRDHRPLTSWPNPDEAWREVEQVIRLLAETFQPCPATPSTAPARPADPPRAPTSSPSARPADPPRAPTASSLRRLIGEVLRLDPDLDAFCIDYFPNAFRRFTSGMDRMAKENILLQSADRSSILQHLREDYPHEVASRQDLLRYEEQGR